MISCNKCNFIVNGNLLYSIRQNFCPSCGSSLLKNSELKQVSIVSSNLLSNNIVKKLSDDERFILSLFIFKNYVSAMKENIDNSDLEEEEVSMENSYEEIRKEIYDEVIESSDSNINSDGGEDLDEKVNRLKQIHKSSSILNKKGPSVRRINS